ncbi:MAG: hypothetical protein HUU50_16760 [Candidatus Brocadiae bacterium]|nr:hypothetical protein [Candidatus Brocadiia bacterium]
MRIFLILLLAAISMICVSCDRNQIQEKSIPQNTEESKMPPKISQEPIPGGYLQQDPKAENMQKMARKAVELLAKDNPGMELSQVLKAGTQVVAGLNYYFRLELKLQDKVSHWDIIMYEDLGGNCSLTEKKEIK